LIRIFLRLLTFKHTSNVALKAIERTTAELPAIPKTLACLSHTREPFSGWVNYYETEIKWSFLLNYWPIILRQLTQVAGIRDRAWDQGDNELWESKYKFRRQIICLLVAARGTRTTATTMAAK